MFETIGLLVGAVAVIWFIRFLLRVPEPDNVNQEICKYCGGCMQMVPNAKKPRKVCPHCESCEGVLT